MRMRMRRREKLIMKPKVPQPPWVRMATHVPVYHTTKKHIGCSLVESANGDAKKAWLSKIATSDKKSLHIVYNQHVVLDHDDIFQ